VLDPCAGSPRGLGCGEGDARGSGAVTASTGDYSSHYTLDAAMKAARQVIRHLTPEVAA
jgi:hypothetical protein